MNSAIGIFARMSSQRLPGKVLRAFSGRPLLGWVVARAELLQRPIVVIGERAIIARPAELVLQLLK